MQIAKEATMLRNIIRTAVDYAEVPVRYRELVRALADNNMPAYYAEVRRLAPIT